MQPLVHFRRANTGLTRHGFAAAAPPTAPTSSARAWSSSQGPVDVLVLIAEGAPGRARALRRLQGVTPRWPLPASSACPRLTRTSCAAPAASWRVGARSVASTSSRAPGSIARSCAAGKAGFPASVARWPCCNAQRTLSKHDSCRCDASIASSAMPRFLLSLADCMMRCGIAAGVRRGDRRETARFPGGSCCARGWGVGVSA